MDFLYSLLHCPIPTRNEVILTLGVGLVYAVTNMAPSSARGTPFPIFLGNWIGVAVALLLFSIPIRFFMLLSKAS